MGMTVFIQSTILQMSAMNPHQPAQGEEKSLNILYSAYGSQICARVKLLLLSVLPTGTKVQSTYLKYLQNHPRNPLQ